MRNQQFLKLLTGFWTILSISSVVGCNSVDPPPTVIDIPRDEAPAWSPDGNSIAYHHFNPNASDTTYPTGLYVLNLENGKRGLVIKGPAFNPDWSPDGKWLAFNSGDIFIIRPDGTDLQQITDVGSVFFPAWSPERQRIAYDATSLEPQNGIWLIDETGKNSKYLGLGRNPDWSPDGGMLTYQGPPGVTGSENQIWKADTSGKNPVQLTNNNSIINRSPAWSPNGKWLVWTTDDGVRIMKADGSDQQLLIEEGSMPSWDPNSGWLVFSRPNAEETKMTLWMINRDGSGLKQITF